MAAEAPLWETGAPPNVLPGIAVAAIFKDRQVWSEKDMTSFCSVHGYRFQAKRWLVVLFMLLPVCLAGQHALAQQTIPDFYDIPASQLNVPPGTLLRHIPAALPAFYRAKAWRILYSTRDFRGQPIAASGIVVQSEYGSQDPAQRNFVAWAHPTIGTARVCAPSLHKDIPQFILGLDDMISEGFIVTATDYPGLGTVGPAGYLVGRGQAYAVIDSVRAARQIPGLGGSDRYALWGYSQGGQAVLFGENLARGYAPELKLVGVAATAPPTNLDALLRADINSATGKILAAMAVQSWSRKYGVAMDTVVAPAAIGKVSEINKNCINSFEGQLHDLSDEKALPDNYISQQALASPPWSQIISENSVHGIAGKTPVLIMQGLADTLVRPAITEQFVKKACAAGAVIQFVTMPQKTHDSAGKASVPEAIGWIANRFAGQRPPNTCP